MCRRAIVFVPGIGYRALVRTRNRAYMSGTLQVVELEIMLSRLDRYSTAGCGSIAKAAQGTNSAGTSCTSCNGAGAGVRRIM